MEVVYYFLLPLNAVLLTILIVLKCCKPTEQKKQSLVGLKESNQNQSLKERDSALQSRPKTEGLYQPQPSKSLKSEISHSSSLFDFAFGHFDKR